MELRVGPSLCQVLRATGIRGKMRISAGGEDDTILEAPFLKHDCSLHSHFAIQLCAFIIFMQTVVYFSHNPSSECCFVPFVFSGEFVSVSSLNINLPFQLCLGFQFIYFYFSVMILWFVGKNFWPPLACPCSYSRRSFKTVLIDHLILPQPR